MSTISHDHSYIRDEPNITLINNVEADVSDEDNVGGPATELVFNNEGNSEALETTENSNDNEYIEDDQTGNVEETDVHMKRSTIEQQTHIITEDNNHTSEEAMSDSDAECSVVNTEYTVLESGDLETVNDQNQRILVYENQYTHTEDENSSPTMLYLDHPEPLTEEETGLVEQSTELADDADPGQYEMYNMAADPELTVDECAHEMNVDGICQNCGELDLSLLGDAGTSDKNEETSEREPVVLKIDVYDRYGDTIIDGDEDLDELDERSELQGNLVLNIEIKVNPDLSTGYYSGKMYLCNVNCAFHTTDAVNMLNHFKQQHGEYVYEYTMYEFKRYMISLSQSFRHTHSDYCPQCGDDRADAVMFMKCRRFRYLCRSCRFSAKGNHPLVDHLQVHTHQQFHCQLCPSTRTAKRPLAEHFRERHAAQGRLFVGLPSVPTERAPDTVMPWASVRRPRKKRKRAKTRKPKESPCVCPKCDFAADSHTELMNHLVCTHIQTYTLLRRKRPATTSSSGPSAVKQLVTCNLCEFMTINSSILERHLAQKHADRNTSVG